MYAMHTNILPLLTEHNTYDTTKYFHRKLDIILQKQTIKYTHLSSFCQPNHLLMPKKI